jgi:FlaA1/EpsC-like NDP-sugar epimerase
MQHLPLWYPWRLWHSTRLRRILRRTGTYGLFALFDGLVVIASYWTALWLRFDGDVPDMFIERLPAIMLALAVLHFVVNHWLGMYWRGWRYAGLHDALMLAIAVAISTAVVFVVSGILMASYRPVPRSVVMVACVMVFFGMALGRFRHRLSQQLRATFSRAPQRRVLIVGAGQVGQSLARELLVSPALGYRPIGFVDDDPGKHSWWIHGLRVLGTRHDIKRLVKEHGVQTIVFALPSLSGSHRQEMLALCVDTGVQVKMVPGLSEMMRRQPSADLLRDLRLEDLLGRPRVDFEPSAARAQAGQTVLVTGAAGSIGSELASQLAMGPCRRLVLLDVDESRLFELAAELAGVRGLKGGDVEIVVGDVTRAGRVAEVFAQYEPDVVYHAAAYKHVPMMERHPAEAVRANVLGTYNVCVAAERAGCERVVVISTDKAVAPSNVMGATKRVAERIVEAFSANSATIFCAVRFGNVLWSRGSLIPTVTRQIRLGGPITLTHPDMTRYFMTVTEAASLIIEASYQANSGEIFILDMGEPVTIVELVYKMVRLHGLEPGEDIEIKWTGPRPGEKIHESLVHDAEELLPTAHPSVSRVLQPEGTLTTRENIVPAVEHLVRLAESGPAAALVADLFEAARAGRLAPNGRVPVAVGHESPGPDHVGAGPGPLKELAADTSPSGA